MHFTNNIILSYSVNVFIIGNNTTYLYSTLFHPLGSDMHTIVSYKIQNTDNFCWHRYNTQKLQAACSWACGSKAVLVTINTLACTLKARWGRDGELKGGWYVLEGHWFILTPDPSRQSCTLLLYISTWHAYIAWHLNLETEYQIVLSDKIHRKQYFNCIIF